MDDLIAFYRARLDEVEADARAATPGPWRAADPWESVSSVLGDDNVTDVLTVGEPRLGVAQDHEGFGACGRADAVHIARHDPASVLAGVEAKRALLTAYEQTREWYMLSENMRHDAGAVQGLREAIQHLAVAFSSHPDYRPEWRPA